MSKLELKLIDDGYTEPFVFEATDRLPEFRAEVRLATPAEAAVLLSSLTNPDASMQATQQGIEDAAEIIADKLVNWNYDAPISKESLLRIHQTHFFALRTWLCGIGQNAAESPEEREKN